MFLIRLKAYQGESLLSFMNRNATENRVSLLELWGYVKAIEFGTPQVADLYMIENNPISAVNITKLANLTGISTEQLLSMTFYFAQLKFSHSEKIGLSRFMKGLIRKDLYYCPLCLKEKNYIKLKWKITGIDVCLEHQVFLLNKCSFCGQAIKIEKAMSTCPTCSGSLDKSVSKAVTDASVIHHQVWLMKAWDQLLSFSNNTLTPEEVAQRIIYILNDQNSLVDMNLLNQLCNKQGIRIGGLLQYARGTLGLRRSIHLSDLLRILYRYCLDINAFLALSPPPEFISSILPDNSQSIRVNCLAPWCQSYNSNESLVRTGTNYKRLKNGKVQKRYWFCQDCGCSYFIDEDGNQVEKDGFIEAFPYISTCSSINELATKAKVDLTKGRRVFAYFKTRIKLDDTSIDHDVLNDFELAIKNNIAFNQIQKWTCWESYDHFLMYRYHINVLKTRMDYRKKGKNFVNYSLKMNDLYRIAQDLLDRDENITQKKVAKMLGISDTSLRKWKEGYSYFNEVKQTQQEDRLKKRISILYDKINEYFQQYSGGPFYTKDVYNYLGMKQSYLLKIAPEITDYITNLKK